MPVYHTFHPEELVTAMSTLANQIQRFFGDDFTHVIGISRGGLIPAVYLSNQLEIREVCAVGVRSYVETSQSKLTWYQTPPTISSGAKILLVDDLCDTGDTMVAVRDSLQKNGDEIIHDLEIVTATIFYKPKSKYRPDAYWQTVKNDHWVVFPWEKTDAE